MIVRIDEEITKENYTDRKVKTILNAHYVYINTKEKRIEIHQQEKQSSKEIKINISKNAEIRIWEK